MEVGREAQEPPLQGKVGVAYRIRFGGTKAPPYIRNSTDGQWRLHVVYVKLTLDINSLLMFNDN